MSQLCVGSARIQWVMQERGVRNKTTLLQIEAQSRTPRSMATVYLTEYQVKRIFEWLLDQAEPQRHAFDEYLVSG